MTGEPTASERVCLDLFSGLGGFSSAFHDADGWRVVTVDINETFAPDTCADVLDLRPDDLPNADVVLASPPCTRMGKGASWHGYFEDGEPQTATAREHVALLYHTVGLIHALTPEFWFIENPPGAASNYLGQPTGTVTYCQYGRPYQKRTHLWGQHPPMDYRACVEGDECHINTPRSDTRHPSDSLPDSAEERSKVPHELSEEIRRGVEGASEQTTLEAVADGGSQ